MKRTSIIMIALLLILGSCTTFKMSGIQVNKELSSYDTVGQIELEIPVWEFFGLSGGANWLNMSSAAMDKRIYDSIQREISKYSGDAAVNVTVEYIAGPVDIILNGITLTILSPAKAHITGTIIKYD